MQSAIDKKAPQPLSKVLPSLSFNNIHTPKLLIICNVGRKGNPKLLHRKLKIETTNHRWVARRSMWTQLHSTLAINLRRIHVERPSRILRILTVMMMQKMQKMDCTSSPLSLTWELIVRVVMIVVFVGEVILLFASTSDN